MKSVGVASKNYIVDGLKEVIPSRFQQYINIRGNIGQLIQFMAVVAGIKPVLDDWIPASRLDAFVKMTRSFRLVCEIDSHFEFLEESETRNVIGGDKLNTTRARGYPPDIKTPRGLAHVFIARDPDWLSSAVAAGWYTLVVDGRVGDKPWIDHHHFGHYLGYPDCCRRFFAFHNNWNNKNSYYHAYQNTSNPSFLCNSLMKHSGLSYAVHIPCSFECKATMDYAEEVRAFVVDESKMLAEKIDRILQYPYLVLSEWEMFGLVGNMDARGYTKYKKAFIVPTNRPDLRLFQALRAGNGIDVERDVIRILHGSRVVSSYQARSDRFGPQVPFLVSFSKE